MKKKFIATAAATVVGISALLGGCSCTAKDPLSFSVSPENETLTYTVQYSEDYIESYKKDAVWNDLLDFKYENGTYVSSCKKVLDRTVINSDIKGLLNDKDIYELKTDFSIDLTFNGYHHVETISTLTYIAPSGMSLAPLYSKESAEYLKISSDEKNVQTSIVKSESEIFYNENNYSKTKKYKVFKTDEEINFDDAESEEYNGNYTFRTAIDNAELYFSLRGLVSSIKEKSSTNINVISPAYNEPQSVKITHNGNSTEKEFKVKYNGVEIKEDIAYTNLAFQLSSTNSAGRPQYVSIQSGKTGELANLNLPIKFAKPLYVYGSVKNLGCLVFTLSEIER